MIELRVSDCRQRDVARGIGRIDHDTMQKLGISAGEVIEIQGKKTTAAIAWPAYAEDQGKGIIRIDRFIRKNAGASINDVVVAVATKAESASHITLQPTEVRIEVEEDFVLFVKHRLMERVFAEGDTALIMMLGHPVQFAVTKTAPEGIVRMTHETQLQIERGASDKELPVLHRTPSGLRLEPFRTGKRDNTVMTRLSDEDLKHIDLLIGTGLFESRSEAVAYLTHEGIVAKREMFGQLSEKFEQISKIRDEAKALLRTSAPISNLKECPKCGKENPPDSKRCSNCGEKLE